VFTGIIQEVGTIIKHERTPSIDRLTVGAKGALKGAVKGGSMAVNGVCLTMVKLSKGSFLVEVMGETLKKTNVGTLRAGDRVNLEPPLKFGDELGGHLVQGHVEEVGKVVKTQRMGKTMRVLIGTSDAFLGRLIPEGSVAVDGVSLTVASKQRDGFWISLIPHTLAMTNMSGYKPGTPVNLEADFLGRYVLEAMKKYLGKKG
jgi:riboflavin synthase